MWCLLQAPLIIGSDLRSASPAALEILANTEAIRINQGGFVVEWTLLLPMDAIALADALRRLFTHAVSPTDVSTLSPPKLVSGGPCLQDECPHWVLVWSRQLSNNAVAVAVVNMGNSTTETTTVAMGELFCQSCGVSTAQVLDVWEARTTTVHGKIHVSVGPHETKLLRVTPSA
mmetsp:Transcript_14383/g.37046  ORF Transcript_14383/g.37046 Transcript_14383/m.37046 type:complete len:174 (+) Transcript_14383:197-718(+)